MGASKLKPDQVHGRLTLLYRFMDGRRAKWFCKCECGSERSVREDAIAAGITRSCGCLSAEMTAERGTRHGLHKAAGYANWNAMMNRCYRTENDNYKNYGGRGITVFSRWHDPSAFIADMGEPKPGEQIDRIDNNGNYEPGNCRWVTAKGNANNRRNSILLFIDGVGRSINEWAEMNDIPRATIVTRLRRGWSIDDAVNKPSNVTRGK